jgi:hypothetical protein
MRKLTLIYFLFFSIHVGGQTSDSVALLIEQLPPKFTSKQDDNISSVEKSLVKKNQQFLNSFSKQELKIYKKIFASDSNLAKSLFHDTQDKYEQLKNKIQNPLLVLKKHNGSYVPLLDTLKSSIQFLNHLNTGSIAGLGNLESFDNSIQKINSIQAQLNVSEEIRKFIKSRQQLIAASINNVKVLGQLKKFQKDFYYYQATVTQFKESLNKPDVLVFKTITLLRKIPAFNNYFSKHSQLAGMFQLPGSSSQLNAEMLANLQTRETVQNLLQERLGASGNVNQTLNPILEDGQQKLSQYKDKLIGSFGNSSDVVMPSFTPNTQKVKKFSSRIEKGINIQSVRSNGFFPATSDIAFSLGYRASDKFVFGIGGAYKIGWGENIRKIQISHQGVGLRSFVDYQVKGSFYLTGGAEFNYRNQIREFEQLNDISAWQKSILLGVTKKYSINKKMIGNMQLLFDFLYNKQTPRTQFLVFRVGYNLR